MPKSKKHARAAGSKGVAVDQPVKDAFDPAKLKVQKALTPGKHLVQSSKRLHVPGKGRAR
jgi:hypothetical protein